MTPPRRPNPARVRRLAEELAEVGLPIELDEPWGGLLLEELDAALRPPVHEGRVASYGSILDPTSDPRSWEQRAGLTITLRDVDGMPLAGARRFADGLSSWLIRRTEGTADWAIFDRPSGSERDLVVLAEAFGGTLVQRHPAGTVRVVGEHGVLRWDGLDWHHEPPLSGWIDSMAACTLYGERDVFEAILEFAVHDLGSRGIGAILVYRTDGDPAPGAQERLALPPPLRITQPSDLAPLRHALAQVDGAAVFDGQGTLRQLGVRLVPTPEAESLVEGYRGMRHTAGRRYSYDDPASTVVVVSEDGPVTVLRNGKVLGSSPA
jgi:hypothetical protein